jgi:hypothetical protein
VQDGGEEEVTEEGNNGSLGLGKFLFSLFVRSAGLNVAFIFLRKKKILDTKSNGLNCTACQYQPFIPVTIQKHVDLPSNTQMSCRRLIQHIYLLYYIFHFSVFK